MKKILGLFILIVAFFCIKVNAAETSPYKSEAFFMNNCYTKESVIANAYKVAETVNVGDVVVCYVGFETYSTDLVKSFKYTLDYGKGLKLVDEKNNNLTDKTEKTYSYDLNEPTSVGEELAAFTFEVISSHNLNYGIKDIEFTTSDDRKFTSVNQSSSLKFLWDDENVKFLEYASAPFFMGHCYTEESVKANNFKVADTVEIGDKIVCSVTFEINATDKIKSFKYTLNYGSGLKLVAEETYDLTNKTGNTYSHVFETATSVGDMIGEFTFEVIDNKNLQYGIKDIKFVTDSGDTYYSAKTGSTLKSTIENPNTGVLNFASFIGVLICMFFVSLIVSSKFKSRFIKL